jgi:hypothetical protein
MRMNVKAVLLAGSILAFAAPSFSAAAQQGVGVSPGVPATRGPAVRTSTGPRTGARAPSYSTRPSILRSTVSPAAVPAIVYNPNTTLEQRQDQIRAIARANPGDRYAADTFGWQLNRTAHNSEGTFSRGALNLANTYSNASALSAQASWSDGKFALAANLNLGHQEFRPQTVNDLVFGINYLENWYDRACACSRSSSLAEGGARLMGGFLAEPFEPSSAFPGVNPAVFASMTAAAPVEEPLTAVDLADEALMDGRAADAVEAYQSHLDTTPGDGPSVVRMAVALVESGNASDGAALLMKAYRDDPALAGVSLRPMVESWRPSRTRALVTRAVTHANRERSASAWATVAVLMVADDRAALASQMLERSIAAGLDPDLGTRLAAMIADAQK